ncbi:aldo/keto reductase [Flavilitoribacter nigricans]|uniref:Aldo/keto reductase n=1 Tax=Flavilitoribacter nigricans (strain ATCC 23147 / DSM 23189 / NBRC 102662 / NCIMB 1420 / SS-2) TaxID=1122177 RepID=A0A2D0N8D4_FLAN2|nr:aldo/keto reductase [Flavilitoribacter nigricans]PHN04774.1 aldo/keto reductase [Flavilitoribacter nigricans DSM 23189 = NBRC 102662]
MKYNILGNTGLLVSELCLGTMTFGGRGFWTAIGELDQKPVDELVKRSVDAGINFIDTANVYSEGLSEEMTGKAIRNLGLDRKSLVIATKVRGTMGEGPNQTGLSRGHIIQQVEDSLRRLDTDYIDLYQIHGFDPFVPLEETLRALDDLVRSGKVRYIGCSNLAAWHIMKALAYSEHRNLAKFVSLQAYYTIAGRDLEREVIPLLKDQKVGLMVWSPLAGGLLSGKFKRDGEGPEGARRVNFDFPPVNKERAFDILDVMRPMAEAKGISVARLALGWLLQQEAVTTVIIGAKKMEQLEDNLQAVDVTFTEEELQQLDEVSRLPEEYPGWMLYRQGRDRRGQIENLGVKF